MTRAEETMGPGIDEDESVDQEFEDMIDELYMDLGGE